MTAEPGKYPYGYASVTVIGVLTQITDYDAFTKVSIAFQPDGVYNANTRGFDQSPPEEIHVVHMKKFNSREKTYKPLQLKEGHTVKFEGQPMIGKNGLYLRGTVGMFGAKPYNPKANNEPGDEPAAGGTDSYDDMPF